MSSDYTRLLTTFGQGYAAAVVATMQIGGQAMRASAAEASYAAKTTANALRAPDGSRAAALDDAAARVIEGQRRQLHGLRGLATMWSMTALHQFDSTRSRGD